MTNTVQSVPMYRITSTNKAEFDHFMFIEVSDLEMTFLESFWFM